MRVDDDGSEALGGARPTSALGSVRLSRRALLATGLAVPVAASAQDAALDILELDYVRSPLRDGRIGLRVRLDRGSASCEATLYSHAFASEAGFPARSITFDADKRIQGCVIRFDRVRVSEQPAFGLELAIERDATGSYRLRLVLRLDKGPALASGTTVDLMSFLRSRERGFDAEPGASLELKPHQLLTLAQRFFGNEIQIDLKATCTFGVRLAQEDGGISRRPVLDDVRPVFTLAASVSSAVSVGGILAFDGRVRAETLRIERRTKDPGDGWARQVVQLAGDRRPPDEQGTWIGQAVGTLSWSPGGQYVLGHAVPGGKPAIRLDSGDKAAGSAPTSLTFRQWGRASDTLSVLGGEQVATLLSPGDVAPPALLPLKQLLLTRQRHSATEKLPAVFAEELFGRIDDKPFLVDTQYGALIVEGDRLQRTHSDGPRAAGELPAGTALAAERGLTQIRVSARNGSITVFDARVLLRQLTVVLPDGQRGNDASCQVWSRLDFEGTEIALRLPTGAVPMPFPDARGVVTLGEAPRILGDLSSAPDAAKADHTDAPVRIALDGARLMTRRASDNLALNFRFSRMALEIGKGRGRIVANASLSAAGAGRGPEASEPFDDRGLLLVEFPPQHVAEVVYRRRVETGIDLPEPAAALTPDQHKILEADLALWRTGKLERKDIYAKVEAAFANDAGYREWRDFLGLHAVPAWADKIDIPPSESVDRLLARWEKLPPDQVDFYFGASPRATDPDVVSLLLKLTQLRRRAAPATPDARKAALLRDVEALPRPIVPLAELRGQASRVLSEVPPGLVERELKRRDPEFAKLVELFGEQHKAGERKLLATRFGPFETPHWYVAAYELTETTAPNDRQSVLVDLADSARDLRAAYDLATTEDPFRPNTPARLSGGSRLVFRFEAPEAPVSGSPAYPAEALDRRRVREIPFTYDGLTDWGRYDLAVTRRAETLETLPGGRLPHHSYRAAEGEAEKILAHQGIFPGNSIAQRLAEIRRSMRPAGPFETSIELPARLHLSPDQFARFHTRRPVDPAVWAPSAAKGSAVSPPTPVLWSANLFSPSPKTTVRAIWSEDFVPEAFGGGLEPPAASADAPWDTSESPKQFNMALDARDRHQIVALTSVWGLPVMPRLSENDQFIDTSQFEAPASYRLRGLKEHINPTTKLSSNTKQAIYQPASLNVAELRLTAFGGSLRHDSAFVPPSAPYRDLRKSDAEALFPALSVERWRQSTVLGRDIEVEVVYKGFLFPLGIRAALIKLTERRFQHNPTTGSVTAFLIQRRFIRIANPIKSFPAPGQPDQSRRFPISQLVMLTRQTPDIIDPASGGSSKVELPDPDIELHERATGGLIFRKGGKELSERVFWPRTGRGQSGNVPFEFTFNGLTAPARMPLLFVENDAAKRPEVLRVVAAYYNQKVPAETRRVALGSARLRYAEERNEGETQFETHWWTIRAEGRKRAADVAGSGNTLFENDPWLEGADQPPFYPFVDVAKVRLGQVERFIGRTLPPRAVRYVESYQLAGFRPPDLPKVKSPSQSDKERYAFAYLRLVKENAPEEDEKLPTDMGECGDKGGAFARPAIEVSYLCLPPLTIGPYNLPYGEAVPAPVPGMAAAPAAPAEPSDDRVLAVICDMADIFSKSFKLLGLIDKDVCSPGTPAPELRESVEAATEATMDFIRKEILPQIAIALDQLEVMWGNARAALLKLGVQNARLDLEDIYPDVGTAQKRLKAAVGKAQNAPNDQLVAALTGVQASARQFVTVVGRTLGDPVTPMRAALRDQLRKAIGGIALIGSDFGRTVKDNVTETKRQLVDRVIQEITNPANDADLRGLASMTFRLPPPTSNGLLTISNDAAANAVADALDEATRQAFIAYIRALAEGETRSNAFDRARSRAAIELGERAVAASAGQLRDALEAYSQAASGAVRDALLGPYFEPLLGDDGVVTRLAALAPEVGAIIQGGGKQSLDAFGQSLGKVLGNWVRTLVAEQVNGRLAAICAALANEMQILVRAILPPSNSLTSAVDELEKLASAHGMSPPGLGQVLARYERLRTRDWLVDLDGQSAFCSLPAGSLNALRRGVHQVSERQRELASLVSLRNELLAAVRRAVAELREKLGAMTDQERRRAYTALRALIVPLLSGALDDTENAVRTLIKALPSPSGGSTRPARDVDETIAKVAARLNEFAAALTAIKRVVQSLPEDGTTLSSSEIADRIAALGLLLADDEQDVEQIPRVVREQVGIWLAGGAKEVRDVVDRGVAGVIAHALDTLETLTGRLDATAQRARDSLFKLGATLLVPLFGALRDGVYVPIQRLRDDGQKQLASAGSDGFIAALLKAVGEGRSLSDLLEVDPIDAKTGRDRLAEDTNIVLADLIKQPSIPPDQYIQSVNALAEGWLTRTSSPQILAQNITTIMTAVLRGDIAEFVDLAEVRKQVDEIIRKLVPARIKRSYSLPISLKDFDFINFSGEKKDGFEKFTPRSYPEGEPGKLILKAAGEIDLLDPSRSKVSAEGYLPSFAVKIMPSFDIATLHFDPAKFIFGPGKPLDCSLKVASVKLGQQVEFISKFANVMGSPPGKTGFYWNHLGNRIGAGLEVGYRLPAMQFGIGTLVVSNLSIQLSCELPFTEDDALFKFGIGSATTPFTITNFPFSGSGSLALIANAKGIVGFEASMQYGGGAAFAFGPLTGTGVIQMGIFVRSITPKSGDRVTDIFAVFYAGGSVHLSIFSFSTSLYVRLTHKDGNLSGIAIFTFSFSLGIKDIEFSVAVFKEQKGSERSGSQSAKRGQVIDLAPSEYAMLHHRPSSTSVKHSANPEVANQGRPQLISLARCPGSDFRRYRTYTVASATPSRPLKAWVLT